MTLKWNEEHTSRQSDQIEVQGLEPDLLRNYENKFYVAGEKNRGGCAGGEEDTLVEGKVLRMI